MREKAKRVKFTHTMTESTKIAPLYSRIETAKAINKTKHPFSEGTKGSLPMVLSSEIGGRPAD